MDRSAGGDLFIQYNFQGARQTSGAVVGNLRSEGPADYCQGQEEDQGGEADGAEDAASAEKGEARLGVTAEQDDDQSDGGPGEAGRQAGVAADHGHEVLWRLAGGNPPGKNGRDASKDGEAEQLGSGPAFNFLGGFGGEGIIPRGKGGGGGGPTRR